MTFGEKVVDFHFNLNPGFKPPSKIEFLNPFSDKETRKVFQAFYSKFYSDNLSRIYLFGINPGRFGAGLTGVSFTDPIRLENECGIANHLRKVPELSSVFIYEVIKSYGGVNKFYKDVYINAVCPVGFIKDGININYYDDKKLAKRAEMFIIDSLKKQASFGIKEKTLVCAGEGKNFEFLSSINGQTGIFEEIIPLPHPRWIMQYRRKKMSEYVERYVKVINRIVSKNQG